MTRPPCVRLCPAYPGNPRTRIEGESPPFRKGTYGLRCRRLGDGLEGWASGSVILRGSQVLAPQDDEFVARVGFSLTRHSMRNGGKRARLHELRRLERNNNLDAVGAAK